MARENSLTDTPIRYHIFYDFAKIGYPFLIYDLRLCLFEFMSSIFCTIYILSIRLFEWIHHTKNPLIDYERMGEI